MIKLTEVQEKKLEGLGVFSCTKELEDYIIDNFIISTNVHLPNTFLFRDGMLAYNWTSADLKKLTLDEFKKLVGIDGAEETLKYMESLTIEDLKEMEEVSNYDVTKGLEHRLRLCFEENERLIKKNAKLKRKNDKYKRTIFKLEKKIYSLTYELIELRKIREAYYQSHPYIPEL